MLRHCMIRGVVEAGCDEAGRGPLAGSVFAAAVILPPHFCSDELNDSKQLTERQRVALRELIENNAVAWAVAEVTAAEIDRINILNASLLAMHRALDKLPVTPEHIIVDGNRWKPYVPEDGLLEVPADTVVKGDAKYMAIAAASVLAKTYRDDYMRRLHEEYPLYGWNHNMGYPTKEHYEALNKYGPTPYHRMTFNLKKSTLTETGRDALIERISNKETAKNTVFT
ncbi:MAG: ribonuclease HII [Paludibacteraceae bacterium]|nr:ribonuclease HII [Paludibacteraceae bacterium]